MNTIGCPRCGHSVDIDAPTNDGRMRASCSNCGESFAVADGIEIGAETAVLEREKPSRGAMLDIALVGHLRVSGSMSLEAPAALRPGKTIVGREGADIVAADSALSARHFEIDHRSNEFFITDLGSTNGTRLNGETLTQTSKLRNGDRIEAGKTTFVFRTLETIPWNRIQQP